MSLVNLRKDLKKLANAKKARFLARFFKTGRGGYAESDRFLGLRVPQTRTIAKKYHELCLSDIKPLLYSPLHEERLVSLLILVHQFKKGNETTRGKIAKFYLTHAKQVNNWDLVDLSAGYILGGYLMDRPKTILTKLAKSSNLWERRISIIATHRFIYDYKFDETFKIATILLKDKHDLIHKAVGWMLREAGKRNQPLEEKFLKKYYKVMPRTMLRYAIEKFPEAKRLAYLKGKI